MGKIKLAVLVSSFLASGAVLAQGSTPTPPATTPPVTQIAQGQSGAAGTATGGAQAAGAAVTEAGVAGGAGLAAAGVPGAIAAGLTAVGAASSNESGETPTATTSHH